MNEIVSTNKKDKAKLLAVKVTCPNGHLIYESQPEFYVYDHVVRIQISCDACDINERFFILTVGANILKGS